MRDIDQQHNQRQAADEHEQQDPEDAHEAQEPRRLAGEILGVPEDVRLDQDFVNRRFGRIDHLGEPWATPLAEARLSTFLAADKDNNVDSGPEAFLSGAISDAQLDAALDALEDHFGIHHAMVEMEPGRHRPT